MQKPHTCEIGEIWEPSFEGRFKTKCPICGEPRNIISFFGNK
jgi:ribosomal protein S14